MTIWNLLVIVCFCAIYFAVSLVFLQVQKLREELKNARSEPTVESSDPAEYVMTVRREIAALEERLDTALRAIPEQLRMELQGIQSDLRFLGRPASGGTMTRMTDATPASNTSDAYREARLLLANGVDEDRVVTETGLAVEEVSLLKRLHRNQS
ncbi:MAG: hypothetical protein H7839_15650 [Magnetococcus sp. YQC-5]